MKLSLLLVLTLALVPMSACTTSRGGPYEPAQGAQRDTNKAEQLTREAAEFIDEDAERAEALLVEALGADLFYGPAHNNLGVVYLKRSKLYEAANEFEWARKLMPGNPDPRMNLALTLEEAGRFSEAFDAYQATLEVAPEHIATMEALASLTLRQDVESEALPDLLKTIALRGETEEWRHWARQRLLAFEVSN